MTDNLLTDERAARLDEIALNMTDRAALLEQMPFVDTNKPPVPTAETGISRYPRHEHRNRCTVAFIEAMREFESVIANDYLRGIIKGRINSLETAFAIAIDGKHIEDDQPAKELIRTARYYAPLIHDVAESHKGDKERARIITALLESASAVEDGAEAFAYSVFDDSEAFKPWRDAAQRLVDAMRDASRIMPVWAANIGMNANAVSVVPFVKAVRNRASTAGGEKAMYDVAKRFADKARTIAAILE